MGSSLAATAIMIALLTLSAPAWADGAKGPLKVHIPGGR